MDINNEVPKCLNSSCKNAARPRKRQKKTGGIKYSLYCSRACYYSSEVSKEKRNQTTFKNHGVLNISQSKAILNKKKATWQKNLGVDNPAKARAVQDKIEATNMAHRGVKSSLQDPVVRKQQQHTLMENHGVDCAFKSKECRAKGRQTSIERYGFPFATQSPDIQQKTIQTNFRKRGVESHNQDPIVKLKKEATWQKNLGVDNPAKAITVKLKTAATCHAEYGHKSSAQAEGVKAKARSTVKQRSAFATSEAEHHYYLFLKRHMDENAQRQVDRCGYSIDFYLPGYDIYVQFDGDYWHGHQHPIERLSSFPQGRMIIRAMVKDKLQDAKIPNLIRILESEFYATEFKHIEHIAALPLHSFLLSAAYTKNECAKEYANLKETPGLYTAPPTHNRNVLTYQPHFYLTENRLWQNEEIKEKLLVNREKYLPTFKSREELTGRELLRGFKISGLNSNAFSHFSPLWLKAFIEEFGVVSVYDPCAGWGHRLLGAAAAGISYYGIDIDSKTVTGLQKIITNRSILNAEVGHHDARSFIPSGSYQAVFTCPPYFNKEEYGGKKISSYQEWLSTFWESTVRNCAQIKELKYFAFVVNHTYKDDMVRICEKFFTLYRERPVGRNTKNHFQHGKESYKREFLMIFKSPLPISVVAPCSFKGPANWEF